MMRILRSIVAGVVACSFVVGASLSIPVAWAAEDAATIQANLDAAIKAGDSKSVAALITANKGDAAATALIANILLASAQATIAAGNAQGGGELLGLAVISGGLSGANLTTAQALVSTNASASYLVTLGAATTLSLATAGTFTGTTTVSNSPSPSQSTPASGH